MRLVIDADGTEHDVELAHASRGVTLADLVDQACQIPLPADEVMWVDEKQHQAGDLIADVSLREGSHLSRDKTPTAQPIRDWSVSLTGGMHAGAIVRVPGSRPLIIGRSPQADITVDSLSASWSHLSVEREKAGVRIRDTESTNGTWVNGTKIEEDGVFVERDAVVIAGGVSLLIRKDLAETPAPRPGSLHNLTSVGTAPFNRPPRPGNPAELEVVTPPVRKDIAPATKFNILTTLSPIALALVMVLVMGSLQYALLSILSPLLGVGTWYEQKRRRTRDIAEEDARFEAACDVFEQDLARVAGQERARYRLLAPDPATALRQALLPATSMWQRRSDATDFLVLHAGVGDIPGKAPVDKQSVGRLDDHIQELIDDFRISAAPVEVDLTDAGVVGIIGEREGALAVARSLLVQAATHCGPADLTTVVLCDPGRQDEWAWTTWLPHTRRLGDSTGDRWISSVRDRSDGLLRALNSNIDNQPVPAVLLVLDSDVLTEGRESPARSLLGHGRSDTERNSNKRVTKVSGIVVATSEEQLPASCTTVIRVGKDASGTVTRPHDRSSVDDVILAGVDVPTAKRGAVALSSFEDPELVTPGMSLPAVVRLPALMGLKSTDEITPEAITQRWTATKRVTTPIGIGENGSFSLDIVRDGPHGLVGGTTGSGKSEFLRSLVAGLAASSPPTRLTFILIDFKGGAAFRECERLPHTIGTVSNLDAQLANRAIRALEAEMDYRQRAFAAVGADNLDAYLATNPLEPMPRLMLVVDEFAMLAKDYPDVLSSLVSVGAVGRTLGVHMILATQRPAGVVNDDILANTNLRVALRVQSREDSSNVIGVPDAASIDRIQMGRGYIKLGQDDITPVQTAWSTAPLEEGDAIPLQTRPVVFGAPVPLPKPPKKKVSSDEKTDLDHLIDSIVAAAEAAGYGSPRPVWPEALGARVPLAGFTTAVSEGSGSKNVPSVGGVQGSVVDFALSDDPDRQRQISAGWDLSRGNLLIAGIPGYGTSTALSSLTLAMASHWAPSDLDVLILDMGSRGLAALANLPHCVGYVGSGGVAKEQQVRLLKFLRAELDRRRSHTGAHTKMLVLIDGLTALKDENQDFDGMELLDGLYRAWADGSAVGMSFAATITGARAIPPVIDEVTTQKWVFKLSDPYDYSSLGVPTAQAPSEVPGRCVPAETGLQTHVATPAMSIADAVQQVINQWGNVATKSSVVRQLPTHVTFAELGVAAQITGEPWRIPVGVRESDLEPAWCELYDNEHMLIAGSARSGKSTALLAIAEGLRRSTDAVVQPLQIWGIANLRSPLSNSDLFDRVATDGDMASVIAAARIAKYPLVLMIDDAEKIDDLDDAIADFIADNKPGVHLIVAGRSDDLRNMYSHWTKKISKSKCGVLLQPNSDYDGDILGAPIPRKSPVAMTVGRGYVVTSGIPSFIQMASPVDFEGSH